MSKFIEVFIFRKKFVVELPLGLKGGLLNQLKNYFKKSIFFTIPTYFFMYINITVYACTKPRDKGQQPPTPPHSPPPAVEGATPDICRYLNFLQPSSGF